MPLNGRTTVYARIKLECVRVIPLDMSDKNLFENIIEKLGPQKMIEFQNRMEDDLAAFEQAKNVRLPDVVDMTDVLRMYPANIVKRIAIEWEIDSNKTKDQLVTDITDVMEYWIPHIIDGAGDSEIRALRYIAKHENLRIRKAQKLFSNLFIQPEFTEPDDPLVFDAFIQAYITCGLLVVGVRNINGKNRRIITMASDVKRIAVVHTGWRINIDDQNAKPKAVASKKPRRPADGSIPPGKNAMLVPVDKESVGKPGSIYKPGMVLVKPAQIIDDPFQAMIAYAITNYRQEFEAERENCHYDINLANDDLVFKQQITWFLAEWINPATGTTLVEEFVDTSVDDKELAKDLLQMTELFFDRFEVKAHRGGDIIAYGMNTRKIYRLATNNLETYPVGIEFEGRIHPYRGHHKLCGITSIKSGLGI